MAHINIFSFRIDDDDCQNIYLLAKELQRTKSDAVRFTIRQAVRNLTSSKRSPPSNNSLKQSLGLSNEDLKEQNHAR